MTVGARVFTTRTQADRQARRGGRQRQGERTEEEAREREREILLENSSGTEERGSRSAPSSA